jgi:hypothetical protein
MTSCLPSSSSALRSSDSDSRIKYQIFIEFFRFHFWSNAPSWFHRFISLQVLIRSTNCPARGTHTKISNIYMLPTFSSTCAFFAPVLPPLSGTHNNLVRHTHTRLPFSPSHTSTPHPHPPRRRSRRHPRAAKPAHAASLNAPQHSYCLKRAPSHRLRNLLYEYSNPT